MPKRGLALGLGALAEGFFQNLVSSFRLPWSRARFFENLLKILRNKKNWKFKRDDPI